MQNGEKGDVFFLIYDRLAHGGIQTMMLRMVRYLHAKKVPVFVLCRPGGDLEDYFLPYTTLLHFRSLTEARTQVRSTVAELGRDKRAVLVSFDVGASTLAILVEQALVPLLRVHNVTGVFHPHAYFMPDQPKDRVLINGIILRLYNTRSIFFMNEECRASHARRFRRSLSECAIIPLPLDAPAEAPAPRPNRETGLELRVLSVGRLVPFKAYNRGALGVIRRCRVAGVHVSWDIYGYGCEEELIRSTISEITDGSRLRLLGKLQYGSLERIAVDYDIFVGMGTAALEAAALGLPVICAVDRAETGTYGYLHELPFGNLGEEIEGRALRPTEELLISFATSDQATKQRLAADSFRCARRYSVDSFVGSVISMADVSGPSKKSWSRTAVAFLAWELTAGKFAGRFLGRGIKTALLRAIGRG